MKTFIPLIALLIPAAAEPLRTANVTAAVNEVQVYPGSNASHIATVGEKVAAPSSVQTGRRSRTELTFSDSTITRLGQNSVFSFREGGRNVELKQGSVLLQVPKDAGGATIRTATVTAAITGTTVMFEYNPGNWIKLLTLEGTQKLSINGSKTSVAVPAGKMIIMHPNATVIPEPVTIDIAKLVATSPLAGQGTFGPLPPLARELIQQTIQDQLGAKRQGDLLPTNHIISGAGTWNSQGILDSATYNQKLPRNPNTGNGP
ncbi:MAG: FecR family protein [Verrucomicrobiota bacterium]